MTTQHLHGKPSILAIEPDPDRANALTRLVHDCVDATVVVSASADVAVSVMARRMPELILMSAFTAPSDERSVMDFLRQMTNVDVPVLVVWPVFEKSSATSGFYRAMRRSATETTMREALGARMRGALELSLAHQTARLRGESVDLAGDHAACVPRAYRWTAQDVSWLSGVRLSSGSVKQLVNISNSGLLVECDSALMPGKSVTFELCADRTQLWHPSTDLIVPARIVRSEVSKVADARLRYLVAARFHHALELPSNDTLRRDTVRATVGDDDMARLAAVRLQDLARLLKGLESAVVRLGEPADYQHSSSRVH